MAREPSRLGACRRLPGDLGVATTPETRFGIVCANVSAAAVDACQRLGEELAAAYAARCDSLNA